MRVRTSLLLAVLTVLGATAAAWFLPPEAPSLPPMEAKAPARAPEPVDPWAAPSEVEQPALVYDRFETITVEDGLPSESVRCVLAEGETLSVGTERGLAIRRDGAWTTYGPAEGLAHHHVHALARDERTGNLWIATWGGLSRLSGASVRTFTPANSGLVHDVVLHVAVHEGLVWAATAKGLNCYDPGTDTWIVYEAGDEALPGPHCGAVAFGPGRAWIGVWEHGIAELDLAADRWRVHRDLVDDGTLSVAYDAGVLWQATRAGLGRFDGRRWRSYLPSDMGLQGNLLHHVACRGHTAWVASPWGFMVLDGETCVSYRRNDDEGCDVVTWRGGDEVARRTLDTAPPDDEVRWVQGGPNEVWVATAGGLAHGIADADDDR
jgi:hypothetical protein